MEKRNLPKDIVRKTIPAPSSFMIHAGNEEGVAKGCNDNISIITVWVSLELMLYIYFTNSNYNQNQSNLSVHMHLKVIMLHKLTVYAEGWTIIPILQPIPSLKPTSALSQISLQNRRNFGHFTFDCPQPMFHPSRGTWPTARLSHKVTSRSHFR